MPACCRYAAAIDTKPPQPSTCCAIGGAGRRLSLGVEQPTHKLAGNHIYRRTKTPVDR